MTEEAYKGDFAMLRDENGTYHCPMGMMTPDLAFGDDDNPPRVKAMCGEELEVHFTAICPVPDDGDTITLADSGGWAYYGLWELRCTQGHILATSADGGVSEDCQPFDPRHWFGGEGADGHD